jgi:hypothetical protein
VSPNGTKTGPPPKKCLGEDPSLQKITWNPTSKTVIYRSKRHHNTKRNFEIFKAPDFIAAALLHLPPKGQQTVRYYGIYSLPGRRSKDGSPMTSRIGTGSTKQDPHPTPSQTRSTNLCAVALAKE